MNADTQNSFFRVHNCEKYHVLCGVEVIFHNFILLSFDCGCLRGHDHKLCWAGNSLTTTSQENDLHESGGGGSGNGSAGVVVSPHN